jgi:hypothetical protein
MHKSYMIYHLNPRIMNGSFKNHHLRLAKKYWQEHLLPGDIAIDATCGNGHDTVFLSHLLLSDTTSHIFAYDIQKEALENTKRLICNTFPSEQASRVIFCEKSHAQIAETPCPKPPRLIVYNLGYLPGGDKTVTTQTNTTITSVSQSLSLLAQDGALSIMCYPGHDEGLREEAAVIEFLSSLCPKSWQICHHRFINRPRSPSLIWALSKR